MKKLIVFLSFLLLPVVAGAYVNRDVAVVRVMDKAAGKVHEIVAPVAQLVRFDKLGLTVRSCKQSDPFDAENFWMFVEISEQNQGKIFGAWMNRNEPGENPLQHPDYDVWLVECK